MLFCIEAPRFKDPFIIYGFKLVNVFLFIKQIKLTKDKVIYWIYHNIYIFCPHIKKYIADNNDLPLLSHDNLDYNQSLITSVTIVVDVNQTCHILHLRYIYAFSRRLYPTRLSVHSGYNFLSIYMWFLGIEPTTFCAASTMLNHWATGRICHNNNVCQIKMLLQQDGGYWKCISQQSIIRNDIYIYI